MNDLPDGIRVRKTQCETCVFKSLEEGGIKLAPGRHDEIRAQLLQGGNQLCHHDGDRTICCGGRRYQLEMWCRMGILDEPTDEALRAAMRRAGVEPKRHI